MTRQSRPAKKRAGSPRTKPRVVKGTPSVALTREEFRERFLAHYYDPAFARAAADMLAADLDALLDVAWDAYHEYRKSPRTRCAGAAFADPDFQLPLEWLATRAAIQKAERRQRNRRSRSRILVINGSARSDQTCPGEMSKTWRLAQIAARAIEAQRGFEVDLLDLSRLTSEYGRVIYPCKACVSTAMPLCNWPCSCYPNHALGQVNDWMAEIYPRWVAAHGVLIACPVNWYQAPSVLKLMIDRLVCADGGNPDPTSTGGKDPVRAKQLELAGDGWHYPKHLAGRAFSVVVHADAAGAAGLRRSLCDWLTDMGLIPAGPWAGLDRYLGYFRPYATSHDDLDADRALQREVRNEALALCDAVRQLRGGRCPPPGSGLEAVRKK
jgi:multimeric flavodoxin WrbA